MQGIVNVNFLMSAFLYSFMATIFFSDIHNVLSWSPPSCQQWHWNNQKSAPCHRKRNKVPFFFQLHLDDHHQKFQGGYSTIDTSVAVTVNAASTASFDFGSPSEWDKFYVENNKTNNDVLEWHSSISLDTIASFVPPNAECLMLGCGNSELPATVLSKCNNPKKITLLDTSKTCLDQLKEIYGNNNNNIVQYQCGDASKLKEYWPESSSSLSSSGIFDIIIDKGLTDAILCGEGWDGILERVMEGAAHVLRDSTATTTSNNSNPDGTPTGMYLLISYKLPKSTKEFLIEVGNKVGLDWEFDLPQSNDRVSVSLARRRRRRKHMIQ